MAAERLSIETLDSPRPALRILVIDDNRDAASSMARLLKVVGHEVHVAFDGMTGIQAALEVKPDVILLDLGLPDLSGHEVCRAIRTQFRGEVMSIIAVTGWGQSADRLASAAAGFDEHLLKPVGFSDLQKLLELIGSRAGPASKIEKSASESRCVAS